jgi:hypothetical protein
MYYEYRNCGSVTGPCRDVALARCYLHVYVLVLRRRKVRVILWKETKRQLYWYVPSPFIILLTSIPSCARSDFWHQRA